MRDIKVTLMNTPSVIVDGEKKVFPYRKVEGLFYYICVRKRITRDEAIGIFWVDCDEASARKNLRDALYHIKKIVGPDIISLDGNVFISLNPEQNIVVDADGIRENIMENYKGEFMSFFYVKNCLEFENWMDDYRRELKEGYIRAVRQQAEQAMQRGDAAETGRFSGKLVDVFYLDEGFYRKVLTFLMGEGEYSAAISLYQKFAISLKQDLEEEPEAETKALMDKILKLRRKIAEHPVKEQQVFMGRRKELYGIYESIQNHRVKGKASGENFALISGEAGIGKTALMGQLKALLEQEGHTLLSYDCCSSESDLYLKPWNDILKQVREISIKKRRDLKRREDFPSNGAMDYRIFATQYEIHLEDLLRTFCKDFGTSEIIIFFDDIQWMDPSSIQLLNNLLFHLRDCPVFVVAASRLEPVKEIEDLRVSMMREAMIREIKLRRFTLEETRELIEAQAQELLGDPENLGKIYKYTDGNALFLTEFIKTIKDNDGVIVPENPLTSRMVSIIQSRLRGLTDRERSLLNVISIFYHDVTIEELQVLFPEPEIIIYDLLEGLLERQIIYEKVDMTAITYHFSHILIHNYIQSKISAGRKQIYHRQVAGFYEKKYRDTGDITLMPALIYHFENAKDLYKKNEYKLEYFKVFFSGTQEIYPAMSTNFTDKFFYPDLNSSENVLIPLAEEIRALPVKDQKYQELRMKVEYLIGRYDLSSGDYQYGLRNMHACIEAAKILRDPGYLMDSYLQMIYYAIQVYDLDMMREYIAYCSELLEEYQYPKSTSYKIQRLKALYYSKTEQYERAEELLEALIPELEKLCSDPSCLAGLVACYNYRGEIYMKKKDWENAHTYISKALSCSHFVPPTAGLGMSYTNMGILLYRMDNYDKASEYFDKARGCFQNLSIQWGRAKEEAYSALLELKLGKNKSALARYSAACKYTDKDYSPNTMFMLQSIYEQLLEIPGLEPERPPQRPARYIE